MTSIDTFKSWLVFLKPLTAAPEPKPEKQHPPEKDLDNLARNLGSVGTSFDRAAAALAVIAAAQRPRDTMAEQAGEEYQPGYERPKVAEADDFRPPFPTPTFEDTRVEDDRRLKLRAMDLSEQLTSLAAKARRARSEAADFSRRVREPDAPPPPVPLGSSAAEKAARKAQAGAEQLAAQVKSIELLMALRDKRGTTSDNKAALQAEIDELVGEITGASSTTDTDEGATATTTDQATDTGSENDKRLVFADVAKQGVHAAQRTLETAREKVDLDDPDEDTERLLRDIDLLVARTRLMQEQLEGVLRG